MSLADSLAAQTSPKGPPCSMAAIIAALDTADLAALNHALNNPGATSAAITRALQMEGHKVTVFTLNRHRKGGCACGTR